MQRVITSIDSVHKTLQLVRSKIFLSNSAKREENVQKLEMHRASTLKCEEKHHIIRKTLMFRMKTLLPRTAGSLQRIAVMMITEV